MLKSKKVAILWYVAAASLFAGSLLAEPRRPLGIVGGVLLCVVGTITLIQGNRPS